MQAEMDYLPEILLLISSDQLQRMQKARQEVWHRFMYSSLPLFQRELQSLGATKHFADQGHVRHLHPHILAQIGDDDALTTILQWLHSKLTDSRNV